MRRASLVVPFALALSACAVDEAPPESGTLFALPPGGSYPPPSADNCPNYGCGKNTAAVGPTEFHELHQAVGPQGTVISHRNSDGVRIVSVRDAGGRPMRLEVSNTTLRGIHLEAPYHKVTGGQLVGTRIELHDQTGEGHTYVLTLEGVGSILTWVSPIVAIEKYYFTVDDGDGVIRPLCKAADFWATGDALDGGKWGGAAELHDAIIFAGDRYDRLAKTVVATGRPTAGWFNIGCAGTALPKLVLNRLTDATDDAAHLSSPHQRQAALRAITATYCPDSGVSYTYDGVELLYTNAPDWMGMDYSAISALEAVWDADGPVCLATPRLADAYPGLIDTITADCGLPPPCSQVPLNWTVAGYFFTAIP